MVRVVVLMVLATADVGARRACGWGCGPNWARRAQPVAQFLAAFPANLFFPIVRARSIVQWGNVAANIWLTPLMVLGTQWYILFNVIAGAAAYPGRPAGGVEATSGIGGGLWWRQRDAAGHRSRIT